MLELTCHAASREIFWQSLADAGFVSLDAETGEPSPAVGTFADSPPGMHELDGTPMIGWHEIGDLVKTPAVMDEDGMTVITPAVMHGRWHVNLRGWGTFERAMLAGNDQREADSETLKWLFDRTNLLYQYPDLIGYDIDDDAAGTARGYRNDVDCYFYDPADLNNRANVWA